MKRLLLLLWLVVSLVVVVPAQQPKKKAAPKRTTTTRVTPQKKAPAKKTQSKKTSAKKTPAPTVNSLKSEQAQVRKQIQEQERKLQANERDVKKRLQNLMVINNEIADKRRTIDTIRQDITRLDGDIHVLDNQLHTLQAELDERKQRYMKSMRYMHRNRNIQSQLMFIFSADHFSQMYRRMRFVREYAAYQQAQGEAVQSMQAQVREAYDELKNAKRLKDDLLYRGEREKKSLESKQVEQQQVVTSLKKEQKAIQGIIAQQKKRDAELNARIDKLIEEEIARAKARAEAEAKRKAEAEAKRKAEAEAAKKRAEELARKKAAAEAAAKEHARRIAEAKAKEEKAKAEARAAAKRSAEEKARAERAAREAEKARKAAERKAAAEANARKRELAAEKKRVETVYTYPAEDLRLSSSFEGNQGRLPMPIVGGYKIVHRFGTNTVTDVKGHVTLDKKGIDIKGQPGAQVRTIFDGEVTAVFGYGGKSVVIVKHGSYLSVYCDLASVSVSRGQHVSTKQAIGRVGSDGLMQFQLRRGTAKLNPEGWLAR